MNFLYPLALIGLPLGTILLFFVYRRTASGEPMEIPTLFLLRHFATEAATPRKFLPPIRFLFELLLVLLLTLAASGLSIRNQGKRSILVVDNGFQTAAWSGGSSPVFGALLDQARGSLRTTLTNDSVLVLATAPRLHSITDGFVSSSAAASALSSLGPVYASGELKTKLTEVAARDDADRIVVASPQPIELGEGMRERSLLLAVGLPHLNNLAIEKIWQSSGQEIAVQIHSFSAEPAEVAISLSAVSATGSLSTVSQQRVRVDPGQVTKIAFPLSPGGKAIGYRAKIESPAAGTSNVLQGDDESWLSLSKPETTIGIVSYLTAKELNLDRVLGSAIEQIPVDQVATAPERIAGWIFHRTAPQRPTGKPSLYILPPADSTIIRSTPFEGPWQVAVWESASPLFRYLSPDTLRGTGGATLETGKQFTTLMRGDQGPLVAEGFLYDTHSVVVGFEALPFLGKGNSPLSILLLNTVRHLFPDASANGLTTYATVPMREGAPPRYLTSSPPLSPPSSRFETAVPGLITFGGEEGIAETRAVTFFDESESNLLSRRSIKMIAASRVTGGEKGVSATLVRPLVAGLLVLLTLDGLFTLFTLLRSRRKAA